MDKVHIKYFEVEKKPVFSMLCFEFYDKISTNISSD
jgi:hypothetical protein